jgi:hypothetical protein
MQKKETPQIVFDSLDALRYASHSVVMNDILWKLLRLKTS